MSLGTAFLRWFAVGYVPAAIIALATSYGTPPLLEVFGIAIGVGLLGTALVAYRQSRQARRW